MCVSVTAQFEASEAEEERGNDKLLVCLHSFTL